MQHLQATPILPGDQFPRLYGLSLKPMPGSFAHACLCFEAPSFDFLGQSSGGHVEIHQNRTDRTNSLGGVTSRMPRLLSPAAKEVLTTPLWIRNATARTVLLPAMLVAHSKAKEAGLWYAAVAQAESSSEKSSAWTTTSPNRNAIPIGALLEVTAKTNHTGKPPIPTSDTSLNLPRKHCSVLDHHAQEDRNTPPRTRHDAFTKETTSTDEAVTHTNVRPCPYYTHR